MPPSTEPVYKAKVCILGEEAVGKSSLIYRFVKNDFEGSYIRTLGTQVSKKDLIYTNERGAPVHLSLMIWDIMGKKGFLDLVTDAYFYRTNGLIAVLDVTRPETFQRLALWIEGARGEAREAPLMVLGNKADLKEKMKVGREEMETLGERYKADWFFTSAKTGENVEKAFDLLGRRVLAGRAVDLAVRP